MTEFRIEFFIDKKELGDLAERITGLRTIRDWGQQLVVERGKTRIDTVNGVEIPMRAKAKGKAQAIVLRTVMRNGGRVTVSALRKALKRGGSTPSNLSTIAKKLGFKRGGKGEEAYYQA